MRRSQDPLNRLSSSATSIRASNYTLPRSTGPSLSSYRVQNYVPASRYSSSSTSSSSNESSGSSTLTRTSTTSSSNVGGSGLTRSTSTSFASPYRSPANVRSSSSQTTAASTFSTSTMPRNALPTINGGTTGIRPSVRSLNPSTSPPSAVRSRSSSALNSYRSINIAQLNKQAQERAVRDEKDRQYQEWLEREKLREQESIPPPPPPPPSRDFRKENGQASGGYSQFVRSVTTRSEIAEGPKYVAYKPVATVSPYAERDRPTPAVQLGFTGLRNIGNTCFMNATLQMLVNNVELKTYFLNQYYKADINQCNPLGFKGRLADAFAEFMRQMWNGQHRAIEPVKIKELVAEKAPQFANFAQHDAHEFLSFLLDGLHEDLNRVRSKPYTEMVESDGRPDIDVSMEAWRNHTLRNDSIFVDLFHGQLKSRLQCPRCDRVSITFDPFVYLPVPFPKVKKHTVIHFWPLDPHLKPVKITVAYASDGNVQDLLDALSDMVNVTPKDLRLIEAFSHRVQKVYKSTDTMADICSGDVLYAFQVHSAADCHEEVVELTVLQRQLFPPTLRFSCNNCGRTNIGLKACEACYNAYYCHEECQLNAWNSGGHKEECGRRPVSEAVGQPFLVSLPKSQLTYQQLMRVIEPRCRYSVNIFQAPQVRGEDLLDNLRNDEPTPVPTQQRKSPSPGLLNGTSKRQAVIPERRTKSEQTMFILRKLKDQTQSLGEPIVDDPSGNPLEMSSGSVISVNWVNVKHGKPFITVDSRKDLDIDTARTDKLSGRECGGNGGTDPTLQQMLGMFAETERLKAEESWYCNKCKDHVEATKKLELYRLPPVLIVQLKRFVYTATYTTMHRRSKDERRVEYPLEGLDMSPYLATTAPDGQETIYDLTGVVCHSGSSYFGHYISTGRLADFDSRKTLVEWRSFDDSVVNRAVDAAAQSNNAYLLFYKQRGKTTSSVFRKHYACDPTEEPPIAA